MKNLRLLNQKCEGWTPESVIDYVKKCNNPTHTEKEFVDFLIKGLLAINFISSGNRVFLYLKTRSEWSKEAKETYSKAATLYEGRSGVGTNVISVIVKRFQPEEKYNYFLVEVNQCGEKAEFLFLEELN